MCSACAPYIYCVFFALAGSSVNFAAVYESQFAGPMLLVVLRAAAILVGTLFAALLERRRPSRGRHYSWLNYITQAGVALSFAQEVLDEPSLPLSMRSYVYTLVVTTAPPPPPRACPLATAPPSTEPRCMGRVRSSSTSWSGHHASRSHCASPARPSSTTSEARAWSRSRGRRGSIGARGAATCACIAPGERGFSLGAPHRGQDADVGDAGGRRQLARRTGQRERDGQAGGTAAERGALATSAGRGCRREAIRLPLNAGGGCRQRRGARRRGVRQAAPFSGAIAPSCHQACGVMRRLYGAPRAVIHQNDPSRRAAQLSEPRVAIAREPCGGNVHDTSAGAHL